MREAFINNDLGVKNKCLFKYIPFLILMSLECYGVEGGHHLIFGLELAASRARTSMVTLRTRIECLCLFGVSACVLAAQLTLRIRCGLRMQMGIASWLCRPFRCLPHIKQSAYSRAYTFI